MDSDSIFMDRVGGRFGPLVFGLLALLLVVPWFQGTMAGDLLVDGVFTFVTLGAVFSVARSRPMLVVGGLLGAAWQGMTWLEFFVPQAAAFGVRSGALALGAAFLIFTLAVILRWVLVSSEVDHEVVFGAVAVYLLLGVACGLLFALIETATPGGGALAFIHGPSGAALRLNDFIYFSFITLATVGYGDVAPVAPFARSLAVFESITGVLYLAVLIARLVALAKPKENRA